MSLWQTATDRQCDSHVGRERTSTDGWFFCTLPLFCQDSNTWRRGPVRSTCWSQRRHSLCGYGCHRGRYWKGRPIRFRSLPQRSCYRRGSGCSCVRSLRLPDSLHTIVLSRWLRHHRYLTRGSVPWAAEWLPGNQQTLLWQWSLTCQRWPSTGWLHDTLSGLGSTEKTAIRKQSISGNYHSLSAFQSNHGSSGHDGISEVSDGVVFWHLFMHLNIF